MLHYFDFGFKKVLPILYDNYLSNTEILNDIISRFNEFIKSMNTLEEQLNSHLSDYRELNSKVGVLSAKVDAFDKLIKRFEENLTAISKKLDETDKTLKQVLSQIKYLENRIDDIYDYVDNELSDAVTVINEKIAELTSDFEKSYKKLTEDISNLDEKVDRNQLSVIKMLSDNYYALIKYVNYRFDHISVDIKVINPFTGKLQPLQDVLNYLKEWVTNSLSAFEYDSLYLTAEQYDFLNLTAFQYDNYGIHQHELYKLIGYDPEVRKKPYDVYGMREKNTISSVMQAFGFGVDSQMNNFDLTVSEYDFISTRYNAYLLDKYGKYILSNHYSAVLEEPVKLITDTIVSRTEYDSGYQGEEISFILELPIDLNNGEIPTSELLTDKSVDNLLINFQPEVVPINDGSEIQSYESQYFTVSNIKKELVSGGIAINAVLFNGYVSLSKNTETEEVTKVRQPILIDVQAQTFLT